jgi:hypothetical protein
LLLKEREMQSKDLQHETMRIYETVVDIREDGGGALVLCCGTGCASSGAPAAVSIAGGTTLAVNSDATEMKAAMRAGYLDFVVNTLDEALRTLKNEIRQKRPLSVGVIAEVDAVLAEMVERGVQPDIQLIPSAAGANRALGNSHTKILCERGMPQFVIGVEDDSERPYPSWAPYRPFLIVHRKRHYEYYFSAPSPAALREIDATLLAALPAEDIVRRRWIERVPKYLREARSGGRWTWLSDEELEGLEQQGLSPAPQP